MLFIPFVENSRRGAGEVALWIRVLVLQHEDLNSNPQYPFKDFGMAVLVCNPSPGEVGSG